MDSVYSRTSIKHSELFQTRHSRSFYNKVNLVKYTIETFTVVVPDNLLESSRYVNGKVSEFGSHIPTPCRTTRGTRHICKGLYKSSIIPRVTPAHKFPWCNSVDGPFYTYGFDSHETKNLTQERRTCPKGLCVSFPFVVFG